MGKIAKNIKKIRNVKGLSQQAFANLFQLTRGNISSYEESRAEPKIEVLTRIAKYFSISLNDLIEKDLSVNELLHYDTNIVAEPDRMKINQLLVQIPFVPALYANDFVKSYKDEQFIRDLPQITLPCNSRFPLIALEINNQETMPADYNFNNGDILVFERVGKENAHRISEKLGFMVGGDGIKTGIYTENALALNEWVKYPFDIESENQYWVLKASYVQK